MAKLTLDVDLTALGSETFGGNALKGVKDEDRRQVRLPNTELIRSPARCGEY